MPDNQLTRRIIGAAMEVHRTLGPGLLESTYELSLAHELTWNGIAVQRQVGLPLVYKGIKCDLGYRIDLLVENSVIVEVKSVEALHEVHIAQLLTYLRLSNHGIGLLINFNVDLLSKGIKRLIN